MWTYSLITSGPFENSKDLLQQFRTHFLEVCCGNKVHGWRQKVRRQVCVVFCIKCLKLQHIYLNISDTENLKIWPYYRRAILHFYSLSWYLKQTLDFSHLNDTWVLCITSWRKRGFQGIWRRREQFWVPKKFQAAAMDRLLSVVLWNKFIHKGSHCSVKEDNLHLVMLKCCGLFPFQLEH